MLGQHQPRLSVKLQSTHRTRKQAWLTRSSSNASVGTTAKRDMTRALARQAAGCGVTSPATEGLADASATVEPDIVFALMGDFGGLDPETPG